jgi:selenocysteine lyase/cysteine desulfurase
MTGRRRQLHDGLRAIRTYEMGLLGQLLDGLESIPGARVWGITDRARIGTERTPTAALTLAGVSPHDAAVALGQQAITAWDGDFYARALIERLGLAETGGVLRLGLSHYNTAAEVDRLVDALSAIAAQSSVVLAGARAE